MKINPLNCLISVLIGALLTYGLVTLNSNTMKLLTGIGAFIFLASTLTSAIGITFSETRKGVNVRILSFVFFTVALFINLFFAILSTSQTGYIVTCGILFLLYLYIAQAIYSAEQ